MSYWLYRDGGTRAYGTGASVVAGSEPTQAEWDDLANCFNSSATALIEWWRIYRSLMQPDDELVFYDEADGVTLTTHNIEFGNIGDNAGGAGTYTIRSRSNTPSMCRIQAKGSGTIALFYMTSSVANVTTIFKGVSFGESTTAHTTMAAGNLFRLSTATPHNLILDKCQIGAYEYTQTVETTYGLIQTSGSGHTVTLNDCAMKDITCAAGYAGGIWGGWILAGDTLNITGTFDVADCDISTTAGPNIGMFKISGTFNMTAAVTVNGITIYAGEVGETCYGLFNAFGTATITGPVTFDDISITGGKPNGMIRCTGPHDISNVTGRNITSIKLGANSIGALLVLSDETAIGTVKNISGDNISCYAGSVVYYSNGAGGNEVGGVPPSVCEQISATNCTAVENGGGVYKGGDGSVTFRGMRIDKCHCVGRGGGFYGMHADRNDAEDTHIRLENFTITNCTTDDAAGGAGIYMTGDSAVGDKLYSTLLNGVCRNGGVNDILLNEAVSDLHIATITNCNIENESTTGIDHSGLNTAPTIDAGNTEADPLLDADGVPAANSILIGAGTKYWTGPNPVGADGEPFSDWDTDIGSIQSTHGLFHPKNL